MKEQLGTLVRKRLVSREQPIIAWRSWRLQNHRVKPSSFFRTCYETRLTGTWSDTWYGPYGLRASCEAISDRCSVVLSPSCACGIWGCKTLGNLIDHGTIAMVPGGCFGQVALWGAVLEYQHGFRAMYGKPTQIWLGYPDNDVAQKLAAYYGIPVNLDVPIELVNPMDLDDPSPRESPDRTHAHENL